MRVPYTKRHQARVVMLGEDGENLVSIAKGLISAAGDTATAYFNAQNKAKTAQTSDDEEKWLRIAALIKGGEEKKPDYMPWIVGGGIGVLALVMLSGGRRRR